MKRILTLLLPALLAGGLTAGDFEKDVDDLRDQNLRSGAIERLAKAGDEAFEDLMDGLKLDPKEEGIDAEEQAERSAARLECARLLGALDDTRASDKLLELLQANSGENPEYPWLAAACANSLGRIWSDKTDAGRSDIVAELEKHAGNTNQNKTIRWASLHGLAHLRTGADVAAPIVKDAEAANLIRSAAISVVVGARHDASADDLLDIWETQRLGEKDEEGNRSGAVSGNYTKPLGLQALFGLATLLDARAVPGLVDVATMNEFATLTQLREEAIRLMRQGALETKAVELLVATFKDVDKPTQHQRSAQTLGEFGAVGVTAYLDIADDEAPTPKEGEPEDKYKEDHYSLQVDRHLSSLRSDEALAAFVEAYGDLPAEAKTLREKIVDHLLANRNSVKEENLTVFKTAANDTELEAPKRAQAINAWAEAKGKEAFSDLEAWVKSEDGVIRAQAVQNLGRSYIPLAKSKPLLVEAAKSAGEDFAKARQNALQGLQRSDDKELLQLFLDALDPEKETDADTRNAALRAIDTYRRNARIDDDDVFPAVKARVSDPSEDVRATALRQAVTMAQRMGKMSEATEIVESGLEDDSDDVRIQAYGMVSMVATDIEAAKVVRAALLEETRNLQGHAVSALNRVDDFGDDIEQQKRIVDLTMKVIDDRIRENDSKLLLGKLVTNTPALFSDVSDKVRGKIEEYTDGDIKQYAKVPVLIKTLVEIDDVTYFKEIKKLAEIPNVEVRRAAVEYIAETGTKSDIPFLRELQSRTDSTAAQVRANIDEAIRKLEEQ